MSTDAAVIEQILEQLAPELRAAVRDATVEALLGDTNLVLRGLIKRVYDEGFRAGLAERGGPQVAGDAGGTTLGGEIVEETAEGDSNGPDAVDWGAEAESDEDEGSLTPEAESARAAILPHATIGTLRRRISEHFELDRFDIDVIICRMGDPARRQLSNSARLRRYLIKEEA